jgi:hypothetical protein
VVAAADGRWHLGLGVPTVVGWVTTFAYLSAALLSYRAIRLHAKAPPSGERRLLVTFWAFVFCAMTLLGVNKALDLQSWLTEIARGLAQAGGWYEQRGVFQGVFVAIVGLAGFVIMVSVALIIRPIIWRVLEAFAGLGFLVTLVLVRASSWHYVDVLLGSGRDWVLELGGIALVFLSALHQSSDKPGSAPRKP